MLKWGGVGVEGFDVDDNWEGGEEKMKVSSCPFQINIIDDDGEWIR